MTARSLTTAVLAAAALASVLPGCGGSSKKSQQKASGTPSTSTTSTKTSSSSTTTTSGSGVTSAPGSGNPYGPNSPTEPSGLGRILVKDKLVKPAQAKCTATGLLKELSPPEVQALAQNRASKELKSHVSKAATSCAGGAPSGG